MTAQADPREFERLAMPCLGDVARFARSLTRDTSRADDLVQETYLQALRGWHTFRPEADIKRWLLAICHHAFVRAGQREARYVEAPDDDPELESLATARAHRVAYDAGIGAIIDQMELGPALDRAMATLPEHFRGAVVLVDVEGQSYEEAAVILDVAVGTVRSRLFRARRLLQDLLFEHARDAGFPTTRPSAVSIPRHAANSATTGNPPAQPTRHEQVLNSRRCHAPAHRLRHGGAATLGLSRRPSVADRARRGRGASGHVREMSAPLSFRRTDEAGARRSVASGDVAQRRSAASPTRPRRARAGGDRSRSADGWRVAGTLRGDVST